jgi:hypothetical protein
LKVLAATPYTFSAITNVLNRRRRWNNN